MLQSAQETAVQVRQIFIRILPTPTENFTYSGFGFLDYLKGVPWTTVVRIMKVLQPIQPFGILHSS